MLDVAVSYNRYKFLGYEYLTWLWFVIENERDRLTQVDQESAMLDIGNRIVLENRLSASVEKITITGDDAGLEEGKLSLRKGAVVIELNLTFKSGSQEWRFTLKGDSLAVGNLKVPPTGAVETQSDLEGAILEKTFLCQKAVDLIQNLYREFIRLRLSHGWDTSVVPRIKNWIRS